jgi:hypoxanthine phosphoribosyltransferase
MRIVYQTLPDGRVIKIVQIMVKERLHDRVRQLGKEVLDALKEADIHELTVVSIMTGSLVFTADLIRLFDENKANSVLTVQLELVRARCYRGKVAGEPEIDMNSVDRGMVGGRNVLLVDDIIDTGRTLQRVHDGLKAMAPASLKTVVLLQKKGRRQPGITVKPDHIGFDDTPDAGEFAVGYGLDYDGVGRQLNWIGVLREES